MQQYRAQSPFVAASNFKKHPSWLVICLATVLCALDFVSTCFFAGEYWLQSWRFFWDGVWYCGRDGWRFSQPGNDV